MLSVFPELFTYSLFAPLILRLAIGAFYISRGYGMFKSAPNTPVKIKASVSFIAGIFLCLGLLTQIAALVVILLVAFELWRKAIVTHELSKDTIMLQLYILIIAISLLLLGPGLVAIDYPL